MKTHEQIVSEWAKAHGMTVSEAPVVWLDLCRRVAEEQRERDAVVAYHHAESVESAEAVDACNDIAAAIRQQEQ